MFFLLGACFATVKTSVIGRERGSPKHTYLGAHILPCIKWIDLGRPFYCQISIVTRMTHSQSYGFLQQNMGQRVS